MSFAFDEFASAFKAGNPITARDTLALRQWSWADGEITEAEAGGLFDLNDIGKSTAREWVDCFVESVSEYVVNSASPKGYVSAENAAWLMARIDKDGRVGSLGELELLVKILEKATNAPDSLKTYALAEIEKIILTGTGPTRDGGQLRPATVDAAEVTLLRRLVFAAGGEGPGIVNQAEAEMLFRIKDATLLHNNAPEWQTLFVQGVANYLLAQSSYVPLVRDEAARLEAFMDDKSPVIASFFDRAGTTLFGNFFAELFGGESVSDQPIDDDVVDTDEAAWLVARIEADTMLDPMEKALLQFVCNEGS
jgi:hypothetical protein